MARWRLEEPEAEPDRTGGRWRLEPLDWGTAYLRGLGDSLSLSLGDEAMGGIAGARAALGGGDFRSVYDAQAERSRANLEEANRERPLSTFGGQVTGYLVPGFGIARAGRVGLGVGGRLAAAAGTGAALGGVSGFGAGENMQERLSQGATGVVLGGALGGGLQAVGEVAPLALRVGRRAVGLPARSGRMGVAEEAQERLTHLARQNEALGVRDFNDIGPVLANASARDASMTTAEALGRPAINTVVKYSRLTGRTSQRAEEVLERNSDTFDELTRRLDDTLTPRAADGSPLTTRTATGELDAAFQRASIDGYQPALARPLSAVSANRMQAIFRAHPEFYERAIQEAQIIARGERVRIASPNDARFFHYVKVAASDILRTMRREGLGATRARQYTQSIRRLVNELDRIPGYRNARREWGSLSEAREAMDAGVGFDRLNAEDMADITRRLTPFQQRYLQAGVSARVRDVLERRDNDGLVNIARDLTNRRRGALLRLAFGDRAGPVDDFLQFARTRRRMHSDAVRMASSQGSPTGIITGEMPPITKAGLIDRAATAAWNATGARLGERHRDLMGRILLTPVGEFDNAGRGLLTRARREATRRQSRRRIQQTRNAYLSGLSGMAISEE